MMTSRSRCLLLLLFALSPATLQAQAPLNPTVRVLPKPSGSVPPECAEGLAPAPVQRVQREEVPVERDTRRDLEPPPRRDLRGELQSAQIGAEHGDRASFSDALNHARSLLATYPPGGERTAANDVLSVYNDLDKLWEYQFTSPTGAFFDANTAGGLLPMMTKYRGYEDFIRRQTLVDANGTRFYPARETRDFLAREAADRLSKLGFPARRTTTTTPQPAPATSTATTRPVTQSQPQPQRAVVEKPQRSSSSQPKSSTHPRSSTTASSSAPHRPTTTTTPRKSSSSRSIEKTKSSPARTSAPVPAPVRTPVPLVVEDPPIAPPIVNAQPPASTTAPSVTETTASTASVEPVTTTTAPPLSETVATATETTTQAEPQPPAAAPAKTKSILLPVMMILIGVGVLIVLFRASS